MGKFGAAGTRTKRVFTPALRVNLSAGEHLHYFITVKGATPIFNLSCEHKTLWTAQSLGPPAMNYDRVWPNTAIEVDTDQDEYVFMMSFFAAVKYTLRIERHDAAHQVLAVVEDIDYESTNHSDKFREFITIKVQ